MSDTSQGPGWWLASDGRWYPPETWTGPPQAPLPSAAPATAYGSYAAPAIYPGAPYGGPYGGVPMPARTTNGFAVASLVCACCGVIPFFFGLSCILGIVFGFVARTQIRNSNGTQSGGGLALAGIIVGFSLIVLFLIVVIMVAVFSTSTHCIGTFNSCSVN